MPPHRVAAMLNYIWLGLVLAAVVLGGLQGNLEAVTEGAIEMAKTAVTLAIGLVGIMALWLGIMRLAERSGLVSLLARGLRPVLTRLFPDVPPDHPAMGAMVLNTAANMLGLANASTPLGLRAMAHLEKLNPHPGIATNAMCTFLAINTSSVQLIPATAIAVLASAGSTNPTAIVGSAFLATICSTAVGIAAVKTLEKLPMFRVKPEAEAAESANSPSLEAAEETALLQAPRNVPGWGWGLLIALLLFFLYLLIDGMVSPAAPDRSVLINGLQTMSLLAIPFLLAFFPLYAALRGVAVYEELVEGAKEGFQVGVRIIPFLVAILVAIGMFRNAGGIDVLSRYLGSGLAAIGFPVELLPMVLVRPLSGSGTLGIFSELAATHGPDAMITRMAATIFGSTETTFYVIAVYFGSVAIRRTRHAIAAGLLADLAGVIAAIVICRAMFG